MKNKVLKSQQEFSFYQEVKRQYVDGAREWARKVLKEKQMLYLTTDDVWRSFPPPRMLNGKIMGNIFKVSDFESIGFKPTRRPSSHGRVIRMFRLKANV